MQTEEHMNSPERRCPSCGAVMPAEGRFCGACGMEWTPAVAPSAEAAAPSAAPSAMPTPPPVAPQTPLAASATTAEAPGAAPATPVAPATPPTQGRVCPWCGVVNALDGGPRCASCGAVFPTPEGDEALERAARARIQSMERDLKPVRGGWWPFRGRQGQGA